MSQVRWVGQDIRFGSIIHMRYSNNVALILLVGDGLYNLLNHNELRVNIEP